MKNTKTLVALLSLLVTANCAAEPKDKDVKTNINVENLVTSSENVKFDLKIRYVDAFEIMQKSKLGAQTAQELMETNKKWAEELTGKGKALEQEMMAFKSKESTMSDAAREKEGKRLTKAKRDYDAYVEEKNQDFQREQAKATEKILKEVRESASLVAKADGIDVVVDKMSGQVLYNSTKADYSDKIVASMDKKFTSAKPATAVADNKKAAPAKATA